MSMIEVNGEGRLLQGKSAHAVFSPTTPRVIPQFDLPSPAPSEAHRPANRPRRSSAIRETR
jgi:hypothetical protein